MSFFRISKLKSLVDEVIRIKLISHRSTSLSSTQFHQPQPLTLYSYIDQKNTRYLSLGHFNGGHLVKDRGVSEEENCILDLHTSESVGGSYRGVDPMAFLWSMRPEPGSRPGSRLLIRDASENIQVILKVYDGHLQLDDLKVETSSPEPLASTSLIRTYLSDRVDRIPVHHGRLRGTLFVPKDVEACPGVVDLFGMGGGNMEFRAAILASKGFVTFSLAYFRYQDLPENYTEQDMNYFEEGVDYLRDHPKVKAAASLVGHSGVGVIGVSKGGEIACLMASLFGAKIRACVVINTIAFATFPRCTYRRPDGSVFVMERSPLTPLFQREPNHDNVGMLSPEKGIVMGPFNVNAPLDIILPTEHMEADLLYVNSLDDYSVPLDTGDLLIKRMKIRRRKVNNKIYKNTSEIVRYEGAGHLLEIPSMPLCDIAFVKEFGVVYYGGNSLQHHVAQCQFWNKLQSFLNEKLKPFNEEKLMASL